MVKLNFVQIRNVNYPFSFDYEKGFIGTPPGIRKFTVFHLANEYLRDTPENNPYVFLGGSAEGLEYAISIKPDDDTTVAFHRVYNNGGVNIHLLSTTGDSRKVILQVEDGKVLDGDPDLMSIASGLLEQGVPTLGLMSKLEEIHDGVRETMSLFEEALDYNYTSASAENFRDASNLINGFLEVDRLSLYDSVIDTYNRLCQDEGYKLVPTSLEGYYTLAGFWSPQFLIDIYGIASVSGITLPMLEKDIKEALYLSLLYNLYKLEGLNGKWFYEHSLHRTKTFDINGILEELSETDILII